MKIGVDRFVVGYTYYFTFFKVSYVFYVSAYGIGHSGGSLRRPRADPRPAQATRRTPTGRERAERHETRVALYTDYRTPPRSIPDRA